MRARWLVLAVAAGLAAALWWWLAGPGNRLAPGERGQDGEPVTEESPGPAAPPALGSRNASRAGRPSPRPQPRPQTGTIEGTVRRDGQPVAARVSLRRGDSAWNYVWHEDAAALRRLVEDMRSAALQVAETGEDGRFSFEGVALGSYVVRAEASGGVAGWTGVSMRVPGARASVDIALEPAVATLSGRVVHADQSPWRGDIVVFAPERTSIELPCVGASETDSEGRFTFRGLLAGRVFVMAVAADGGYVIGSLVTLPSAAECVIVWEAHRVPVAGRVLADEDRAPVVGADVTCWSDDDKKARDAARTDTEGRFRVLAPRTNGAITIVAPGFTTATTYVGDTDRKIEILLVRPARIHGLVVRRGDGGPVPGAEVTVLAHLGRNMWRAGASAPTDESGRFVVEDLEPGTYSLYARGGDQVSAAYGPPESAARLAATVSLRPRDDVGMTIETVPAARIRGTVTDADGTPVEGAVVSAGPVGRSTDPDAPPREAYGFTGVATDQSGAFEITSLVPGVGYEVGAGAPGQPEPPTQWVRALAGAPTVVAFVLPRGRWVEVTVLEAGTDAPVAGAMVSADQVSGRTDAAGRVRIGPLGPGEVSWYARAEGFVDPQGRAGPQVTMSADGRTTTFRLVRGLRITGRVLRPGGEPAADALVWLKDRGGGTSTRTGEEGEFEFEGLGESEWKVHAVIETEGLVSETVPVAVGASGLTLRLSARSLVVRVLDADGNPVPSAKATYDYDRASGEGTSHGSGEVQDGRLVILFEDEEPPDTGTLWIEPATDDDAQEVPVGKAQFDDVRPGREVVVRLPRERTIEGRVLGPDGKGVAGVPVRAERVQDRDEVQVALLDSRWTWGTSSFARTDAAGSFRIDQLGEEPVLVAVLAPPAYAPAPTFRCEAGATSVEFRLRRAATATVTVLGPDGAPVAGAQVVVVGLAGQPWRITGLFTGRFTGWSLQRTTESDGRVHMEGLDPEGSFVLGARGPADSGLTDAIRRPWRLGDTELRLSAGLAVSGVVHDAEGKALGGATVSYEQAEGDPLYVRVAPDGTFRVTGLTAGTVKIEAQFWCPNGTSSGKWIRAETSVPAGTEGIDLRLR